HGFSFRPGTEGFVVSVADDFLTTAIRYDPEAPLLWTVADDAFRGTIGVSDKKDIEFGSLFQCLLREARNSCLGSISARAALIKLLLVGIARTRAVAAIETQAAGVHADLYRRYRKLIEGRLRDGWRISRYAAELCISSDR